MAYVRRMIDTEFLISHHMDLEEAPAGYKLFHDRQNEYTKIVLRPGMGPGGNGAVT